MRGIIIQHFALKAIPIPKVYFKLQVAMDDPNKAFKKVRTIIREIVNLQSTLQPMFDIDFANLSDYPTVEERLNNIREEIAPQQLFF